MIVANAKVDTTRLLYDSLERHSNTTSLTDTSARLVFDERKIGQLRTELESAHVRSLKSVVFCG